MTEGQPSPSEALFAFAGWLTTRREAVTFSAAHDAARPAELVGEYCEVQGWAEPRDGWEKNIHWLKIPEKEAIDALRKEAT